MSDTLAQAPAALRYQITVAKRWLLPVVVILLLGMSGAAKAVTVTASPTACANVTGIGTVAWGTPGNAVSSNASYATALVDATISQYLQCTNYGFAIPAGATITGVTVNVTRKSDSTSNGGSQDAAMRLVKAGTPGTIDRSTATIYTTSNVIEAHGSATDLWGTTWTPADINAANFGAAFAATKASGTGAAHTVSVDFIQITVDYFLCTPPSNIPGGVTVSCVCDVFARSTLNPSTIFGANWIVSTSDSTLVVPSIVNPGYLRLTNNTGNNAKAATVPGIFPASGNYISVEFQQYAYNGSGADGIAVTLSDYAVTAVPGAFGGSLGYAQKVPPAVPSNVPGFAGGWIGVALDEFGNYQNPTEGRIGGPGAIPESIGVRGSAGATGITGYNWLAGTSGLSPLIDNRGSTTPSLGYYYQVVVDARTPTSTAIAVNRDTGSGYTSLISVPNVFTAATAQGFTQAAVPSNWQISFTGSTGGSTNIHEIGGLKICAQTMAPPTGGTASGFNAIDEGYGIPPAVTSTSYNTGHIYTKLVGTPFKLDVAALNNNQILTTYAISSSKSVTVKLVDNSDNVCVLDSTQLNYCSSACTGKAAVTGGSQTLTFISTNSGQKQSTDFTLNSAYAKLAAIISDGTTTACSTDVFSVRPTSIASVVSSANANNTSTLKAGDTFTLTATTTGVALNPSGYNGVIQISPTPVTPATFVLLAPTNFPAAVVGTPSSTATFAAFTYGEVGSFQLLGFNPATDTTSVRGVYDSTWTAVDSLSTQGDCIVGSYSNTKDVNGKYGCNFGLLNTGTGTFGRFIPDHFALTVPTVTNRNDLACNPASSFTYMGEPLKLQFTLTAQNAANATTKNYTGAVGAGSLAKLDLNVPANFALGALDSYSASAIRNITQITKANPGVVTTSFAHGYATGDTVYISSVLGMVEVNNASRIVTVIDATHFSIGVDTSAFTTYTAGGITLKKATSGTDLGTARLALTSSAGTWTNGVSMNGLSNLIPLIFNFNRLASVDGSYISEFGIAPVDTDGVKLFAYDMDINTPVGNDHSSVGLTSMRYGRIRLTNAYGSELLPLPVPFTAQYFQSGIGWVANADDSCTQIAVPASGAGLTFYAQTTKNQLAAGEAIARMRNAADTADVTAVGIGTLRNGLANFRLTGPLGATVGPGGRNFGFVDVTPDLSAQPWLQFNWAGSAIPINPTARATFGTYKSPVIYMRENY